MVTDTKQYYCPRCGFPMDGGMCRKCSQDEVTWEEEVARKKINGAVICGAICFCVTLLLNLTGMLGSGNYYIFDLALLAGLTLGVFLKSRVCAVLLFTGSSLNL